MTWSTGIRVTTSFPGFHRWPNAPDSTGFLRNAHRHVFHVIVVIQVQDSDRELEFFSVKRWLAQVPIGDLKRQTTFANGSTLSCEEMARHIATAILDKYGNRAVQVEVSEDNENGGLVSWIP